MSRIEPTVARRGDGGWDFSWPPGTPPYQVWLGGLLLASPTEEAWTSHLPHHEDVPPDVEVVEASDDAENSLYPSFLLLQWSGITGAFAYLVESYTGDSAAPWETVTSVREVKRGYYQYRTPQQADGAVLRYRVSAMDVRGNAGAPIEFDLVEVCNPGHPSVDFSTSSSGAVVVSEGS